VLTLPNPSPDRLLEISWETFGTTLGVLCSQIKNYGKHLSADACIGINDAGLALASFLNFAALDRQPFGYIRTKGGRIADATLLPELDRDPVLVLADFELKTGRALRGVVTYLRERYGDPVIYLAVTGALTNGPALEVDSVDDLAAAPVLAELGVTLFFAATIARPGIEPPFELP
jgi:hypothetical protein